MKTKLLSFFFFAIFFALGINQVQAQRMDFTPYDDLPSIEKILKPTYNDNMPDWGKMLYQYPINFNEINESYVRWERANRGVKTPLSRYFKIWRQQVQPYTDGDGTIRMPDVKEINANLVKAQSKSAQMRKAPEAGNNSNWTFWGPKQTFWTNDSGSSTAPKAAPWQANVYSFDVTVRNPNVLYAGTETGFVSKTIDQGKNWILSGQNYPFGGGVTAITIHPKNSDTVFVAAGNTVHKSFNGGANWGRCNSASFNANRLKIDSLNPKKIIAATDGGIYISKDRGLTWARPATLTSPCWDVEFKPNSSDTIFALSETGSHFFKIMQSNDAGLTFAAIGTFPTNIAQSSGGLLAMTPKNPNIMYVVMLSDLPYIYKGTLAGGTWSWTKKYTGFTGLSSGSGMTSGQGYFDLVLEASPLNENLIFAGTTSLYKSLNGGTTMSAVGGYQGSFSIHPDIQDMKMLSNGDTWVATDGGMNLSTDNFTTQAKYSPLVNGLVGSNMWGFDQAWNEDLIVGGRYHNGNTAIADYYGVAGNKALRMGGGESPTGWILKGKIRHAAFDDLGDGIILPKNAESQTQGRFTFSKYPNMDQYGSFRTPILTHPNYSGTLYVGNTNNLWVSTDYGVSYDLLYTFTGNIRYIDISSANPNVMYADIIGLGFHKSTDGGLTWTKPTNTGAPSWNGQITFAISPYNADVVYACKQIGVWDSFNSEMYRSVNGGASWTQWSTLNRSIKAISIQPTTSGKDLVYAATSSVGGATALVFFRKDGDASWTTFATNYPAGMNVQAAAPFFRDSKLRIAGNAGVWESPFAEPDFTPVLVPWVEKRQYSCSLDTVKFEDHSYVNHQNASWNWEITPAPSYISNANSRNPKAVFSSPGKYTVTMNLTKDGVTQSKTMTDMFEIKSCPSVDDCSNPAEIAKTAWRLVYADSYQAGNEPAKAFDGNTSTIWHTSWATGATSHPHEIQIDLGKAYNLSKMIYYPRTDGSNGRIKAYELYVSNSKTDWGTAVKVDSMENSASPKTIKFNVATGQYVRLVGLSEVNKNIWASAAEISFVGCNVTTDINTIDSDLAIKIFPVPSNSKISITLPFNDGTRSYTYSLYSSSGQLLENGKADISVEKLSVDISKYSAGYYYVKLADENGVSYRAKFIKQ